MKINTFGGWQRDMECYKIKKMNQTETMKSEQQDTMKKIHKSINKLAKQ